MEYDKNASIETRIQYLLEQIPVIEVNGKEKPLYISWGNKDELIRKLVGEDFRTYPLCWVTPTRTTRNLNIETKEINIILAALSNNSNDFNQKREQISFEPLLNPYAKYIEQTFVNSGVTSIDGSIINIDKAYNITELQDVNAPQIWDALVLNFNITYNIEDCLNKKINYHL